MKTGLDRMSIAQKKTVEGKGVAVTEEIVSNNTDILALIFYHHYSSRKGKGLPITRHEVTDGEQSYSFVHA